jgi:hypothetical protein
MQAIKLKDAPKGEYFKRKPEAKKVYTREEYCRDIKKFQCQDTEDFCGNGLQLKGDTIVFIGFTY